MTQFPWTFAHEFRDVIVMDEETGDEFEGNVLSSWVVVNGIEYGTRTVTSRAVPDGMTVEQWQGHRRRLNELALEARVSDAT